MCVYVCMYVCMYTRIQHPHHQHWSSSGLCSLPTAILALHKWLHCYWPLCQTPEVCRWHHNHRSHPGRRQVCLQTRGWAAGCLVQSQQPGAEHAQNCRGDSGLQEKPPCSLPPLTIMNSTVTAVESFRFLGTTISQDLKWAITLTPSWKRLRRGCSSFVNWKSSTCHRRIWHSFTLLLLSRFCAPL